MAPGFPDTLLALWITPDPTNGIISSYEIRCYTPSGLLLSFSYNCSVTLVALENLTSFTNYTCTISATTGAGSGNLSEPQTASTDEDGKAIIMSKKALTLINCERG